MLMRMTWRETMIDFEKMCESFIDETAGSQKRITSTSPLGIYYGISPEGYLRLSFLSTIPAPKLESTNLLIVQQGKESDDVYWTCFDLLNLKVKKVYYSFCSNIIEVVSNVATEKEALLNLRKRYATWKSMFKKDTKQHLSLEMVQGLFGELYFLKNKLSKQNSIEECINAWSGPDATSKDFSIGENWYEIKTIGANSTSIKINSIAQLSSSHCGHLVIIKVEKMSDKFSNGESSIEELFKSILTLIDSEIIEEKFIDKITSFGVDITNESFRTKFDVKTIQSYWVNEKFPRINDGDIKFKEICDVNYSLILNTLSDFAEE